MGAQVMGILNVTPDSFSDGGEWFSTDAAVSHGLRMLDAGAQLIDVGAESTRPGALPVPEDEELARAIPVVRALARVAGHRATISIDTTKPAVAAAALDAGATYVNDVSAFREAPEMAALVAERGVRCCLMHMLGSPRTMQHDPHYDDVVGEVAAFLSGRAQAAIKAGIAPELIDVDPGIGFGKTTAHNTELLRRLGEIVALGHRVVIGVSRKSFIGRIAEVAEPRDRIPGTIAANVLAYERGARIFRVHDVEAAVQALAVVAATLDSR